MGKMKGSIAILLATVLLCGVFTVAVGQKSNAPVLTDSSYMQGQNLAAGAAAKGAQKLIDGDSRTIYRSGQKNGGEVVLDLQSSQAVNAVILKEKGMNIKEFILSVSEDGVAYKTIFRGDKVEYQRLCTFPEVTARYVKLRVEQADGPFALREMEVYRETSREQPFRVTAYLSAGDANQIAADETLPLETRREKLRAYFNDYNMTGITHMFLFCGFAFDEEGTVFLGTKEENQQEKEQALQLMLDCVREKTDPNMKLALGMGKSLDIPGMNQALGENQGKLIANLIDFANRFGFDGIDVDYEFPQSDYDFQVFSDFLVALKKEMTAQMPGGKDALLSCAFGTKDLHYTDEAKQAIDMVNVMTYDIMDQDGQHSSFWSCAIQGGAYMESIGFPKEKINLGIPFYGTQEDALMEQYIYKDMKPHDYFNNYYTASSYYDGSPTRVYFNAPALVRDKTAYTMLKGYGGAMVFSLTCDTGYESDFSLWRAVYDAVDAFGGEAV